LFDLDGTLVDSAPDVAFSIDAMLSSLGRPACGESRVRNWIGSGAERLVKRALTGDGEREPDAICFAPPLGASRRSIRKTPAAGAASTPACAKGSIICWRAAGRSGA